MAETRAPDVVAPPPGHPRFPLLDSLRAIAALAVLASHVGFVSGASQKSSWGSLVANGIAGVTVFFVLSGFLLYRPFLAAELDGARPIKLRDYARRRLLRILPAYWLALTVIGAWLHLHGVYTPDFWRYYLLLQVYSTHTVAGGIVPAWTLCVELSFYLLLPLYAVGVAWLLRRAPSRSARLKLELGVLALLAAISVALKYLTLTGRFPDLYSTLPPNFAWFAVGMALAIVSVGPVGQSLGRAISGRAGLCWLAAGVTYVVLAIALHTDPHKPLFYSNAQWMTQYVLSALVAFALVSPAVFGGERGGWPRRLLAWRWLAYLGLISYGIYLWQSGWVEQIGRWTPGWDIPGPQFLVVLVPTVVLTAACAAISYHVLERPLMRFKNQRPASAPPAPRGTAAAPASARVPVPGSAPGSPR